MAKKKKTTRKKTTASSRGKKKVARKPATRKKTTSRKTASKKASSRKKVAKKVSRASAKKKATKKKPGAKKTSKKPARKTVAKKTTKKAPASKKSSSKKKTSGRVIKEAPSPAQANAPTLTDARAAAAKLAAMAGLPTLKKRTMHNETHEETRPKLTKTPFNKRQLDKFRGVLLVKRAQVLGDVTDMEDEALGRGDSELSSLPQHLADQGSDEYDQSLALGLAASQRALLLEIDDAIGRIDNKTYGICELTGVPIKQERLDETPWARYSVEGARMADSGRFTP